MDKKDYAILDLLKKNARIKASDISRQVHLSVSTVIERIKKMESDGIIKQYTTITNERSSKEDITVFMEVGIEQERFNQEFSNKMKENPYVTSCYYITGELDFYVKVKCRSSEELDKVHKWIKGIEGVQTVRTHYVLKTVKETT